MGCCTCCEKTGACCTAGVCTIETCADCEAGGGVFQGVDTTCDDGDCADICCLPVGQCPGATGSMFLYYDCVPGYFQSACERLNGEVVADCDGYVTYPGPTGYPRCTDGGPTQLTITVTGAAPVDSGNPVHVNVAAACNASFVIDWPADDCFPARVEVVDTVDGYDITVQAGMLVLMSTKVTAQMSVSGGSYLYREELDRMVEEGYDCNGDPMYDCSDYTMSAGNDGYANLSVVDFTNATLALS